MTLCACTPTASIFFELTTSFVFPSMTLCACTPTASHLERRLGAAAGATTARGLAGGRVFLGADHAVAVGVNGVELLLVLATVEALATTGVEAGATRAEATTIAASASTDGRAAHGATANGR